MTGPEHSSKLTEGVEAWKLWRRKRPETRPDLIGEDLRKSKLNGDDLRLTKLCYADLSGPT